jgi:hypothetical protein
MISLLDHLLCVVGNFVIPFYIDQWLESIETLAIEDLMMSKMIKETALRSLQ